MNEEEKLLILILEAREQRWARRQAYARQWPALLSMTLCVPMPLRADEYAHAWFRRAQAQVLDFLRSHGMSPTVLEQESGPDGPLLMAGFSQSPQLLKTLCVQAEQTLPGGRLLDLDVTAQNGAAISRRDLNLPPRQCFLCGRPAAECSSRASHPREEVLARAQSWMDHHQAL